MGEFLAYEDRDWQVQIVDIDKETQYTLMRIQETEIEDWLKVQGHLLYTFYKHDPNSVDSDSDSDYENTEPVGKLELWNLRTREKVFSLTPTDVFNIDEESYIDLIIREPLGPASSYIPLLYFPITDQTFDIRHGQVEVDRFGECNTGNMSTTWGTCCAVDYKNKIIIYTHSNEWREREDKRIKAYSTADGKRKYVLNNDIGGDRLQGENSGTDSDDETAPFSSHHIIYNAGTADEVAWMDLQVAGNILMTLSLTTVYVYNIRTGELLYTVPLPTLPPSDTHRRILYASMYKVIIATETSFYMLNFT